MSPSEICALLVTRELLTRYRGEPLDKIQALASDLVSRKQVTNVGGTLSWAPEALKILPRLSPLPEGDSESDKVARAHHRERCFDGLPDAAALTASAAAPDATRPPAFLPDGASEADRVANARAKESFLAMMGFSDE